MRSDDNFWSVMGTVVGCIVFASVLAYTVAAWAKCDHKHGRFIVTDFGSTCVEGSAVIE